MICTLCQTKGGNVLQCAKEENWKGMNKKKRTKASYLEANSEFLVTDMSKYRKLLQIGILKNGHRVELQPVKIHTGDRVILSNTCSFDAIT